MEQVFLVLLVGLTSLGAYGVGTWTLGLSAGQLRPSVLRLLQLTGMMLVFVVINLTIGLVAILTVRMVTHVFLSVYLLEDVFLLCFSALQGILFECWRESGF